MKTAGMSSTTALFNEDASQVGIVAANAALLTETAAQYFRV